MLTWIRSKFGAALPETAMLLQQAEAAYERCALDEARRLCAALLERRPGEARAMCLMASIAADAGQTEEGLRWAQRAAAADPDSASPHYAAGRLWQGAGRLPEAEASYRRAVQLLPGHARAHNNLGGVLHMQGKLEAALVAYRRALELDPGLPQANQNYASIVRDADALARAAEDYRRHTRANPNDALAFNDLGNTLRELGRHDEALAAYGRALALNPGLAEAHFSRAFVQLLLGDYAQGWKEYEWRWRIAAFNAPARRFVQPIWDGGARPDGTVLLHAEQGLGDTLQFVRYAPLVAQRCAQVMLECQPELKGLMQRVAGVQHVVAQGERLPAFDAHAPLLSLPGIFGTTLDSVPWTGPYVHAEADRVASWRNALRPDEPRLKVGLTWAGRPHQWDDRKRTISLAMLAPLAAAGGVTFYSLQKGAAAAEAATPPAGMKLVDPSARIEDFSDTAALASLLDLVITIDTSVAHLAGAMGLPVWVLTAHAPDWRYHLGREDNPWYPTMRLFRQERDGDWTGAIGRVAAALQRSAAQGND
jgi:tetratricopeptide (TPR) repeat protein